jgi:hypothetical protein
MESFVRSIGSSLLPCQWWGGRKRQAKQVRTLTYVRRTLNFPVISLHFHLHAYCG